MSFEEFLEIYMSASEEVRSEIVALLTWLKTCPDTPEEGSQTVHTVS